MMTEGQRRRAILLRAAAAVCSDMHQEPGLAALLRHFTWIATAYLEAMLGASTDLRRPPQCW